MSSYQGIYLTQQLILKVSHLMNDLVNCNRNILAIFFYIIYHIIYE